MRRFNNTESLSDPEKRELAESLTLLNAANAQLWGVLKTRITELVDSCVKDFPDGTFEVQQRWTEPSENGFAEGTITFFTGQDPYRMQVGVLKMDYNEDDVIISMKDAHGASPFRTNLRIQLWSLEGVTLTNSHQVRQRARNISTQAPIGFGVGEEYITGGLFRVFNIAGIRRPDQPIPRARERQVGGNDLA